jgi:hypothetical protein
MPSSAIVVLLLAISGCASSPDRPVQQMARTDTGIELAEQSGAQDFGAEALARAKEKRSSAEQAAERGDHDVALRLAKEAELDAELAMAQSNRGRAEAALAEINDSIQTLRREVARGVEQ